ncbi:hypothetical protein [Bacillus thuringiensis]|uniref:hypothetical protein n=1 Tax=Bacillus thuringiensis TaxID=1428 RepID=UPI002EC8850C|nr:hypothetical protein [Bacillus thuringiensis]
MNTVVGDNKTIPPASATLWLLNGMSCPLGIVTNSFCRKLRYAGKNSIVLTSGARAGRNLPQQPQPFV